MDGRYCLCGVVTLSQALNRAREPPLLIKLELKYCPVGVICWMVNSGNVLLRSDLSTSAERYWNIFHGWIKTEISLISVATFGKLQFYHCSTRQYPAPNHFYVKVNRHLLQFSREASGGSKPYHRSVDVVILNYNLLNNGPEIWYSVFMGFLYLLIFL